MSPVEAEAATQHYARQQGEARDDASSKRNKKKKKVHVM
jgi:hypothetical protein